MEIETDFSMLEPGAEFPTQSMRLRNAKYRLNAKRCENSYGDDCKIIVKTASGLNRIIPYKKLSINKYRLYTNKMDNLLFNGDPVITCGDTYKNKLINELVNKTQWLKGIRTAIRTMETLGDCAIKTFSNGCTSVNPCNAFKIVDDSNINEVLAYVLHEDLLDKRGNIRFKRFEVHFKGRVFEQVYTYNGSTLGKAINYNYKGRQISIDGNWYNTGVDDFVVQWLSVDVPSGSVYGTSPYEDIAPLVQELERRLTLEGKVIDAHSEPIVAVGMGTLRENEETGEVEALDILGSVLEIPPNGVVPQYITWDGKTEASEQYLDRLTSQIYELTELGKTFMTGEYSGNISDDSINSLVKSAIDRGSRHAWDIYYEVVQSLYVLCKLNGIDVKLDSLSVEFQVGQTENKKTLADVINSRVEAGTLSVKTALIKYDNLTEEQAEEELKQIAKEKGWSLNE